MAGRLKKCCHISSPTGRHIGGLILSLVAAHHTSAEEPKAEAFPGRDRLKPLQTVTAGPPPASPADFSPDTGDPLAFPLRLDRVEARISTESELRRVERIKAHWLEQVGA